MKTYIWSTHDNEGTMILHGQITIKSTAEIVDVIEEIEDMADIKISNYHEFRLKDKIQ